MLRTRTGILALLAIVLHAPVCAEDKSLGSFRAWTAMRFGDGNDLACMAFSQPVSSQGDYTRRGDTFLFLTNRPAAAEHGRVSLETGYTYAPGSTATVSVGGLRLELQTQGSTAWVEDAEDAARLVRAMRAGRELAVQGISDRGTKTLDRYSLYGFSAAQTAIDKACPR